VDLARIGQHVYGNKLAPQAIIRKQCTASTKARYSKRRHLSLAKSETVTDAVGRMLSQEEKQFRMDALYMSFCFKHGTKQSTTRELFCSDLSRLVTPLREVIMCTSRVYSNAASRNTLSLSTVRLLFLFPILLYATLLTKIIVQLNV
jgi:hypothetical protein